MKAQPRPKPRAAPATSQGRHTLICAPTGSGKTLAVFLTCIDGLVGAGIQQGLPDATQVVYVSPLKALSNDIQKNLASALREIASLAEELGTRVPEIRAAVRTGDTKPSERRNQPLDHQTPLQVFEEGLTRRCLQDQEVALPSTLIATTLSLGRSAKDSLDLAFSLSE